MTNNVLAVSEWNEFSLIDDAMNVTNIEAK